MGQSPLRAIPSLMRAKSIKRHARQKQKLSLNSTKEPFYRLWLTISQITITVSSVAPWTVTQLLPPPAGQPNGMSKRPHLPVLLLLMGWITRSLQ